MTKLKLSYHMEFPGFWSLHAGLLHAASVAPTHPATRCKIIVTLIVVLITKGQVAVS